MPPTSGFFSWRAALGIASFCVVGFILRSCFQSERGDVAPVAPDRPRQLATRQQAPEIEGEDIDGRRFKLSDFRGKVVVLDFWGHW